MSTRQRDPHALRQVLLGLLLASLVSVTGCTSASVSLPPTPTGSAGIAPCVNAPPAPALRLWARSTILVSVRTSGADVNSLGGLLTETASAINAVLASAAPSGVSLAVDGANARLFAFGSTGAASFPLQQSGTNQECLGRAVDAINQAAASSPPGLSLAHTAGVWVTAASPDWYTLASGLDYVGGSPSDPPVALRGATLLPSSSSTGKAAHAAPTVYVLDTGYVPTKTDCPATSTTCANLVSQLGLQLYGETVSDETTTSARYRADHSIREHGVFIAAIIRHLAPSAPIQLVRVLNDYGVGSTTDLLAGLYIVWKAGDPNAIVNMSLAVEPPLDCLIAAWQYTYGPGNGQEVYAPGKCVPGSALVVDVAHAYQAKMVQTLGEPVAALLTAGYHLAAAAGNDSRDARPQHLGADLPAAYCGVMAVAANQTPVSSGWQYNRTAIPGLADFSNLPVVGGDGCLRMPSGGGLGAVLPAIPDGAAASGLAVLAHGTNLCSLFVHSQDDLGSPTGAVTWSGTSFATAVISGNLAFTTALTGGPPRLSPGQPLAEDLPCASA